MKNDLINSSYCLIGYRYTKNLLGLIESSTKRIKPRANIEHLHKARVASRRLRSAIILFSNCLNDTEYKHMLVQTKKLTGQLGLARDIDVQVQFLDGFLNNLKNDKYKRGIERILFIKKQKRVEMQKNVEKTTSNFLNNNFAENLNNFFKINWQGIRLYKKKASLSIYNSEIHARIENRINNILSYGLLIYCQDKKEELHKLRISIKKLRYDLEIFMPYLDPGLTEKIPFLKKFQDVLGRIHDYDVWIEFLQNFLGEPENRTNVLLHNFSVNPTERIGISYLLNYCKKQRNLLYGGFQKDWQGLLKIDFWKSILILIPSKKTLLG